MTTPRSQRALSLFALTAAAAGLLAALPAGAADRPAGATAATVSSDAPRFVERPGEMEFTGRLLLRPKSARELAADGVRGLAIERRRTDAVDRIAPLVVEHAAGPDRWTIEVPAGHDESSFAAELLKTGDYAWVHPDWMLFPIAVPNDPQYPQQWHHPMMESEAGWDISVGRKQIVLAFVDSGVDLDHEDLEPLLVPGFNSADDIPQVAGGDVSDINGHGTAVGGCISAVGDNGLGIAGMGWNLSLMPIRCTNSPGGGASLGNILQGAEWAVENGARASSCSYTGIQNFAIQESGAYIRSIGGLLIYAANNFNENHSGFDWEDVVVVGATDQNDNKANFSSYGLGVDVFAPGVAIRTTQNGGGYGGSTGTSFATPIVNGVIGIIWSVDPTLSPVEVEQILYLSSDDKGEPGNDEYWGWGRANLRKAALGADAIGTPQPPVASDDLGATASGYALDVDTLANDLDPNFDALSIASVDPVTSLGGTVEILPGAGPGGRDLVRYLPPAATVGDDTFEYVATDGDLDDAATVTVTLLDPATLRAPDTPAATEPGSEVAYYALSSPSVMPDFETLEPYANDVLPDVNLPSTNQDFATSGRSDEVGAVFTGFIEVPAASTYLLSVESDDGSKLYVGDELVVDNDGLHGMVEVSGEMALLPGKHAVRVEFFENGGGAGCIVRIEGGGLSRQAIPPSMWSYEVPAPPCPGDIDGSGAVDFPDLLEMLAAWGTCPPGGPCAADLDLNGEVGFPDLLQLLTGWGSCSG